MRKLTVLAAVSAAVVAALISVSSAHAQATRTWVSGVGDDANPCSRTAPCKTFAGAISKTARGGEISVLDPGGFGNVTITKSITINGTPGAGYGSILVPAASTGVIINITDPADTLRTVRLNWLDINGAGTAANGVRILSSVSGSSVFIDNTNIDGLTNRGISDERITGGELYVTNTNVRNSAGPGIAVIPTSGSVNIRASINNVRVQNNERGLEVGNGTRVMVADSVFSGNTNFGLQADNGSVLIVNNSVVSANGTGILANAGTTVQIANTDIALNTTTAINGATQSFTNNRIAGNAAAGTAPTPMGGVTNPTGQQ